MMLSLTEAEMLEQWKLLRHLLPLRADAPGVTRSYGIDIDAICRTEMRRWYLRQLDTAPAHLVPVADVASRVTLTADGDNAARLTLPDDIRRVLAVRCDSWHADAVLAAPGSDDERRQRSPYTRSGAYSPVAVTVGRLMTLYGVTPGTHLTSLRCVCEPAQHMYIFDESLLSSIDNDNLQP